MIKRFSIISSVFLFIAIFIQPIFSQQDSELAKNIITLDEKKLPRIPQLSSRDEVFKQFCDDVEFNYRQHAGGKQLNAQFYAYTAQKDDTLMKIAARCVIPYETIATANAIANVDDLLNGRTLVIPTFSGIFVCEQPASSIEILLEKKYALTIEKKSKTWYTIHDRLFYFLPGERFSPTERAFFLDADFKMPLDSFWLSSAYGMRKNPFSGDMQFHRGIDLAAPEGVPVYSCKGGSVTNCVYNNPVYGNYVIIRHNNGMESVYAHLSNIAVSTGDVILGRTQIGLVGQTGLATGPHLHFEIRVNGVSTDPRRLLPKR